MKSLASTLIFAFCVLLPAAAQVVTAPTATANATTQSILASCKPLDAWPPECEHVRFGAIGGSGGHLDRYYRMRNLTGGSLYDIINGTIYQTGLEAHNRLGNALSPYFFGRALAFLAGYNYQMMPVVAPLVEKDWYTSPYFLKYLPTSIPRHSCPNLPDLIKTCAEAVNYGLVFPHEATFGWPRTWKAMQDDMQSAFEQWSKANSYVPHVFGPGDVVVQDRCDHDVLLNHNKYGPPAFSFYDPLKNSTAKNIYVLKHDNRKGGHPYYPCVMLHGALCAYLSNIVPSATVHSYGSENILDMWAWMANAPVFYKSLSTFSLWSGVASRGEVYSMPLFVNSPACNMTPDLGPKWHWVDVPVLTPSMAGAMPPPAVQHRDLDRILTWLMRTPLITAWKGRR